MSVDRLGRNLALVERDKNIDKVKGAKPLKKLTARHRKIIALLLEGFSNNDIAMIMNITPSRVSIIRNDKMVADILNRHFEDADSQMAALLPKAVRAVDKALSCGDHKHTLKASDQLFRIQGKYKETRDKDAANVTAEDVARQIIEVQGNAKINLERGTRISTETKEDT